MTSERAAKIISSFQYNVDDGFSIVDYQDAKAKAINALRLMECIKAIINGDIDIQIGGIEVSYDYIQEDVLRYKAICEVVKNDTSNADH